MSIYTVELDGKQYDIQGDRPPTEQEARDVIGNFSQGGMTPAKDTQSIPQMLLGNLVTAAKATGETALKAGNEALFGLPGMAYKKATGNNLPEESMDEQSKQMATGAALISPLPLGAIAKGVTGVAAKVAKPFMKYDTALQQAQEGKEALDGLRNAIGTAKQIAIKEVENVPTQLSLRNVKSDRIMKAIKNPVYEVGFNPDGSLVQTVGNLDKVKKSVGELIHTPAVWDEAPKTEQQHIKEIYGQINQAMKDAASGVKKPIDAPLKAYDDFMTNYQIVNKTLVDKVGTAQANKLQAAFKFTAEPAIKQAWEKVASSSPEIKAIMNSQQRRAILKNLLRIGLAEEVINPRSISRKVVHLSN